MSDDIGPDGVNRRMEPAGINRRMEPEGAADDLDAEGHKKREPEGAADEPGPEEARRIRVVEDEGDDTEGHRLKR
jgi:hypothetical protein